MLIISKQTPWEIQKSVVFAIFVRELNARFGKFRIGYFWALLEPVVGILALSSVRLLFGRADISGLPFPVFFASGILPFLLFRQIVNNSLGVIEGNSGLFNYQRVKPADILTGRSLLDVLLGLATALIIFPALYLMGFTFSVNDAFVALAIILCLILMSYGIGLAFCVIGPLWRDSQLIIPFLIRPLFFLSGIFFPASVIPEAMRPYALLNPLLHVTDLFRGAMFAGYQSQEGSLLYLFSWAVGCFFIGLCTYRVLRIKAVTSRNSR